MSYFSRESLELILTKEGFSVKAFENPLFALANIEILRKEIHQAIDEQDYVLIKNLAHKTKPTFTYVGFDELRLKIEKIEEMSVTKTDFMAIEKTFQEIRSDAMKGIELLKSFSSKNL